MSTLSVILITKNEANRIEKTLRSIAFADEIIVVDSGSTDNTVEICKRYRASVFEYKDWLGFGLQKQRALSHASCDWIFSIDADEVVSEQLKSSILGVIKEVRFSAYKIRRRLIFLNKKIKHACGEEKILRLAKRQYAYFDDNKVHEAMHIAGKTGLLDGILWHDSFASIQAMVAKLNQFTSLSAESNQQKNKKPSFAKAVLRSGWMFFRVYFLQRGFLDGAPGFIFSYYFAEHTYYKYVKTLFD